MRALVLERPGSLAAGEPLRLRDVPDPQPGAGELVIGVAACAVCRTDLQLVEGDLVARRLPTIPGHQVVGRVEAVGAGVDSWLLGERAAVGWLAGTCGTCRACRT
ncbi:MAG: alcohol dehydrogenase catalytic domain-containing protein, partial [Chloroflexota bacterium]